MHDRHWTDDELVARLYGIGPENNHLDMCLSCTRRFEAIRQKHRSMCPAEVDLSEEQLAAQRRAIYAQLGEQRRSFPRVLVPVLATLLLASAIIVYRPARTHVPPPADHVSDSQLFEDVFRSVSDPAPSAVGPIRSLFEEQK